MTVDDWVKEKLNKIDQSIDKLDTRLDRIDVTLAKQEVSLGDHIRRTSIAEENIELLREDLKPLQQHVLNVQGGLKLIGLISIIVGMVAGLAKIVSVILNVYQ